ncbi:MAG: hypothetical protein ACXIVF_14530 [Rhizobiaceae bacterium]
MPRIARPRPFSALFAIAFAAGAAGPALAADLSCNGLISSGQRMICAGFEPNWAIELQCSGTAMSASFIDAFSGDGIETTPGTISFSARNPWTLSTSHGVRGAIAHTPAGCTDEADMTYDFTFTPTAAPGLGGDLLMPFCCRVE